MKRERKHRGEGRAVEAGPHQEGPRVAGGDGGTPPVAPDPFSLKISARRCSLQAETGSHHSTDVGPVYSSGVCAIRRLGAWRAVAVCVCLAACEARTDVERADGAVIGRDGECETAELAASCGWYYWGQTCEVPCALRSDCSYRVQIDWGRYHCCFGEDTWVDCRCIDGTSMCRATSAPPSFPRQVPTSDCESACPMDGGPPAPEPRDAGVDASSEDDAGAIDASPDGAP